MTLWHVTPSGQVRRCPSATCKRVTVYNDRFWDGLCDSVPFGFWDSQWACGMNKKNALELTKMVRQYWARLEKGHWRA